MLTNPPLAGHACRGLLLAVLCLAQLTATAEPPAASDPALAMFRDQVRPLLVGKCLACHGADKQKGGLNLTTRASLLKGGDTGPAIVPGKSGDSLLLSKLASGEMPPKNPLTPEQTAAFKKWIDSGAPFENEPLKPNRAGPDWWSLQPIRRPVPPSLESNWPRTPIDRFILAKLQTAGLTPAPEADRVTLIRRAFFDLLGLPPTPEEVQAFVSDSSTDAYEKLIDRLLASPHYGERWGRHWLDVVRFGESHGYEMNQPRPTAWPYRDYVIRAFNRDTPFPEFVHEQLAGDALASEDWLTHAASGFLVAGTHDMVINGTVEGTLQQRMDDLDDMITATGSAFLGLTTNCARCHDHKFDPISQRDYYSLQAIFAGVQHKERDVPAPDAVGRLREAERVRNELARLEQEIDQHERIARIPGEKQGPPYRLPVSSRRNVDRFAPVAARYVRFTVVTTNSAEPCIDELEIYSAGPTPQNVALASTGAKASASSVFPNSAIHKLEHVNDGRHGNSWSWISNEPGKGWVQIELPEVKRIDRIVWGRDREEKFKDRTATKYRIEVATQPDEWLVVATSDDRAPFGTDLPGSGTVPAELVDRDRELRERLPRLTATIKLYAGTFTPPGATHLLRRGDPMQKLEEVPPGAIGSIRPELRIEPTASEQERRLALARWIGHPENPLPARVLVNRVWHYHFGQGIVNTPSDFGFQGDRPSHPELLDWLAGEFQANGWRLKPIHRLIMLSSTYRQSARPNDAALAMDRQNRLLWRMSPRRLDAEPIRDAVLATSGQLNRRMGGPSYDLWEKNTNYVRVYNPKRDLGPDEFRRMVYQLRPRTQRDAVFGSFDCPDNSLAVPRRSSSTNALQALNMLNSAFMVTQADAFAERIRAEAKEEAKSQVTRAFWLAFARPPSEEECRAGVALLDQHGLSALCRALYNANEFVFVE